MTHKKYRILLTIIILLFAYSILATLDTMVSLKYETDNTDGCISSITGYDLCLRKNIYQALAVTSLILVVTIAVLKNKIVRQKTN